MKAIRKDDIEEIVLQTTLKTIFEDDFIDDIASKVFAYQLRENKAIPLLQKELDETEKSIGNIMLAIEQGIITPTTKKRMTELEQKKLELEAKIEDEKYNSENLTERQIAFWLRKMRNLNLASDRNKQRIINTFVNSVYVYDDRYVVNYNCREESDVIPLYITTNVSYLNSGGEPNYR